MPTLLLLETSGKTCSVALANENTILASRSASADHFVHAEMLHGMIHELMTEQKIAWNSLTAIAVSKGPGSYTGLRIGVSAAKGLCFSLNIPLIAIDTTTILAHYALRIHPDAMRIIPMIDARRMEVYCACFDEKANRITPDEAVIVDENTLAHLKPEELVLIGDGAEKCTSVIDSRIRIIPSLPNAEMMWQLAFGHLVESKFEDIAYFEPFYLKEYTPGVSRKSIL